VLSATPRPCQASRLRHGAWLVHEATFTGERAAPRDEALDRAQAASSPATPRGLLARPPSTRYFPREIRARGAVFGHLVPRDFDAIAIPFPERAAPLVQVSAVAS
jgi:ribonuclease Z